MELLVDAVEVVRRFGVRVRRPVEVVERLRVIRLGAVEVVEPEAELLGELANVRVALVDQLATVLVDLAG